MARETGFVSIEKPVPYSLTEKGRAEAEKLQAEAGQEKCNAQRPRCATCRRRRSTPARPRCGKQSVDPARSCIRAPGHDGACRMAVVERIAPAPPSRSDASAASAALGRSPALLPCQKTSSPKRCRKPAEARGKAEAPACVPDTPLSVVPATAASGPVPEAAFAPFRAPLVSCRRCIQLMLELDEAVRAYTAVARPFLAQWAQMSFGQVKEFERQTESLKNAVRSARRKLENHQRDAGCA